MTEIVLRDEPYAVRRRPRLGYAMVTVSAALFAINGTVSKVILTSGGMTSLRLTELRTTGAFVGLALFIALTAPRRLRISRDELRLLVFYGVVGFALVTWLYFVAIERLPIGIGLLLEFTAPVLVALWARLVWHEHVRRRVWASLGLALAGLALVAQVWEDARLDAVGVAAALLASRRPRDLIARAPGGEQRGGDAGPRRAARPPRPARRARGRRAQARGTPTRAGARCWCPARARGRRATSTGAVNSSSRPNPDRQALDRDEVEPRDEREADDAVKHQQAELVAADPQAPGRRQRDEQREADERAGRAELSEPQARHPARREDHLRHRPVDREQRSRDGDHRVAESRAAPHGVRLIAEDDLRHRARLSASCRVARKNRASRAVDCPPHGV